jgi:hypothetical protein
MLQKLRKKLKTKKVQFRIAVFSFIFSILLFFTAFHNLDLIQNYALIYNDLNQLRDEDNFNVRKIQDCTGIGRCPNYATIYIKSNVLLIGSFFMMMFVALGFMIEKWEKKYR